ncbi:molybdopterin-guanine dinucleotide biosynthesis protein [Methanofollis sp. W23]|nr:molybdopterin-guanine dinucleotide biosynthesis protein [Methanofollis sp. W23]
MLLYSLWPALALKVLTIGFSPEDIPRIHTHRCEEKKILRSPRKNNIGKNILKPYATCMNRSTNSLIASLSP